VRRDRDEVDARDELLKTSLGHRTSMPDHIP
jgi:hypothetical protein